MTTPAETEARRRAASLAWRARLPRATPEVRAAAGMAEAAIQFAELSAANPPGAIRSVGNALDNAFITGLSGRPAPGRVTPAEIAARGAKVWSGILRHLPAVSGAAPASA